MTAGGLGDDSLPQPIVALVHGFVGGGGVSTMDILRQVPKVIRRAASLGSAGQSPQRQGTNSCLTLLSRCLRRYLPKTGTGKLAGEVLVPRKEATHGTGWLVQQVRPGDLPSGQPQRAQPSHLGRREVPGLGAGPARQGVMPSSPF